MCVCVCIYIYTFCSERTRRDERYRSGARVCLSVCTCVTVVSRRLGEAVCRDLHGGEGGEVRFFREKEREGESVCVGVCVCVRRCVCTWESNSEAGTIKERPTRSPSLTQLRVVSLSRRPRRPPPPPSPRPGRVAAYTRLSNVTPCSLHPGARSGANRERGIAEISRNFTSRVEFARNRA